MFPRGEICLHGEMVNAPGEKSVLLCINVSGTIYRVPGVGFGDCISGSEVLSGSVRASNSRSDVLCFHWLSIRFKCVSASSVILVSVSSFIVSVSKLVLSLGVSSRLSVYWASSI